MLCCVSIDRYFQLTKLNRYNLHMNEFRMKVMIFSILAVSFVNSLISLFYRSLLQQVISASLGLFGLGFVISMYIFLVKRLRNHATSQSNNTTGEISTRPEGNGSSQLSAAKTIQFLLTYLTITYSPYLLISCWWAYYKFRKKVEPGFYITLLYAWSAFVVLCNACGNSWIIIYGNSRSRRFVLSLFRRNCVENDVEN